MPTYREIPQGSVQIQTGLYLYSYEKTILGKVYNIRQLYTTKGYCFYSTSHDSYDEEGNLLPRVHYTYMSLSQLEDLDNIVCIPCTEDCEIA